MLGLVEKGQPIPDCGGEAIRLIPVAIELLQVGSVSSEGSVHGGPHRVSSMFDRFCQDSRPGKSQDSDAAIPLGGRLPAIALPFVAALDGAAPRLGSWANAQSTLPDPGGGWPPRS